MQKKLLVGSLAVVAIVGGVYSFHSSKASSASPPPAPQPRGGMGMMQPQTPPALTDEQNTQLAAGLAPHKPTSLMFNLVGGSFFFVPNEIHVKKGDKVTINYSNSGGFHDFTLDEYKIHIGPIKTGESTSTTFIADQTGTFEYYCSVGKHRQLGQKGNLIVE